MQRAILLNERLYHLKIKPTQFCDRCETDIESYKHFFSICPATQKLWKELIQQPQLLYLQLKEQYPISDIIFSTIDKDNRFSGINVISCIFKQMLYAAKCTKQNVTASKIVNEIEFIKTIEQQSIENENQERKFLKRWKLQCTNENEMRTYITEYIQQMSLKCLSN